MAVGASDIKKLDDSFSAIDSSRINIFLNVAKRKISKSVWGDCADDGVMFLTAHFLTMASRGGVGGDVTKEKVGDLEVSYSSGKGESEFESTSWGKMYLSLRRTLVISPRVVGCPE